MFSGTHTAIVTPFEDRDGYPIDYQSLEQLLEFQIKAGVDGIVLLGTTGECPTINSEERAELSKFVARKIKGKLQFIIGCGTNSTASTIELIDRAKESGADAALLVTPYYNKPTQQGLIAHFSSISDNSKLPLILYNVPSRCGVEISVETLSELSKKKNVIGVKQAVDSVSKFIELSEIAASGFQVFAGDCELAYTCVVSGGSGVISASANMLAYSMSNVVKLARERNYESALKLQREIQPAIKSFFTETNPTPIKHALYQAGIISSDIVRLPLVRASEKTRTKLSKFKPLFDNELERVLRGDKRESVFEDLKALNA